MGFFFDVEMDVDTETDSTIKERVNEILDSLNALPEGKDIDVSRSDILFTFISIVSRVVSIFSTLHLAFFYYRHDKIDYFTWTLCCFIIPMFVTMFLQLSMYVFFFKSIFNVNFSFWKHNTFYLFQLLWRSKRRCSEKIKCLWYLLLGHSISHRLSVCIFDTIVYLMNFKWI